MTRCVLCILCIADFFKTSEKLPVAGTTSTSTFKLNALQNMSVSALPYMYWTPCSISMLPFVKPPHSAISPMHLYTCAGAKVKSLVSQNSQDSTSLSTSLPVGCFITTSLSVECLVAFSMSINKKSLVLVLFSSYELRRWPVNSHFRCLRLLTLGLVHKRRPGILFCYFRKKQA